MSDYGAKRPHAMTMPLTTKTARATIARKSSSFPGKTALGWICASASRSEATSSSTNALCLKTPIIVPWGAGLELVDSARIQLAAESLTV